jgi:hypothetical protein
VSAAFAHRPLARLALLACLAVTAGAASARADDPTPRGQGGPGARAEARRRYEAAEEHFRAGRYEEALREYEAGYHATALPGFLVNIAQCHRRRGELLLARATYRKFVVVAPDSPLVPEVEGLIAELERLIAELGDGGERGATPAPDPVVATPPAVTPATAPPAVTPATAPPAPVPPPPPLPRAAIVPSAQGDLAAVPPPPAPPRRSRIWLWSAIGASVVAGTVAAVLVASSRSPDPVREGTIGTLRR